MALYKWPALRLAFLPGIAEALFDAGIATAVFQMPFTLALSLGFILKAVGPGLVVPAMFQLQKQGLGANKGIPSTIVIAASFDDIIAITGFSIFINVAIATGDNAAWQIASGPLQVGFGWAVSGGISLVLAKEGSWCVTGLHAAGLRASVVNVQPTASAAVLLTESVWSACVVVVLPVAANDVFAVLPCARWCLEYLAACLLVSYWEPPVSSTTRRNA